MGSRSREIYENHSFPLEKPCRTCTDFKTWSQQQSRSIDNHNVRHSSQITTDSSNSEKPKREDCPLDRDELGTKTWGFLHTMAAYYPEKPSTLQQTEMTSFFHLFSKFYPCDTCAEDIQKQLKLTPPITDSQESLSQWLCRTHNSVNVRLGKSVFDCKLVNERWRDGWKDGSCD